MQSYNINVKLYVIGGGILFGKRLRYLRKKRKLTMKEFGAKFGIAESTISGYENSFRFPDIKTIESFADFFEVTVDFLIGRSESPTFTKDEGEFLDDINLSLEDLKEKYNLTVDGKTASEEEIIGAIAWIKANRMINGEQKK